VTRYTARQKVVIPCVSMPYVSLDGEIDSLRLELFGCSRTTDPTRVFLTRMLGNRSLFIGRASGKQFPYAPPECTNVFHIKLLTTFSRALPRQLTSLRIGQALLFRSCECLFFDQYTLSFVPLARTTKANNHGSERRMAAGSARERGISTSKKHQMIEIGTR
jgi:hypothetical protein